MLLVQSQTHKVGMKIWFEVLEHAPLHSKLRALIEVLRAHGAHIACDDFGTQERRMLTGLVEYLQRLGMKGVCEGGRDTATYRIGCDYQQGYAYAMPPLSLALIGP